MLLSNFEKTMTMFAAASTAANTVAFSAELLKFWPTPRIFLTRYKQTKIQIHENKTFFKTKQKLTKWKKKTEKKNIGSARLQVTTLHVVQTASAKQRTGTSSSLASLSTCNAFRTTELPSAHTHQHWYSGFGPSRGLLDVATKATVDENLLHDQVIITPRNKSSLGFSYIFLLVIIGKILTEK